MYSENDFNDFDEFPIPEIKRADLNSLVLQMLSLGLNEPLAFSFIEQPEISGINCAMKDLKIRKAITPDNKITILGRALASLPLEPSVGAILLYGSFLDMVSFSLIYVAALGIQSPFNSSFSGRVDFRDKFLGDISENFILNCEGDPYLLVKAFTSWLRIKQSDKSNHSKIWCRKLGIIERRFYDMIQLCNQFKRLLNSLKLTQKTDIPKDKIRLSKTEEKELKDMKQDLLNRPRKRKILNADFNFIDEDDADLGELDVKEIEFRLGRSGSILNNVPIEEIPLRDKILWTFGISLGLYPQFAIPDDTNAFRKDSEQFFHTKDKQFLSLHPNSMFGLHPECLKDKLSTGKQPWVLVYVGLLETTKPYLLNCTKVAAIPTLFLTCNLDTDSHCLRIVADNWLEIKFTYPQDALSLLCSAISIRNSFPELLEFYFSPDIDSEFDEKIVLLERLRKDIVKLFHRDIDCTLKYIVNADRQIMYRPSAGDSSEIPADLLIATQQGYIDTKVHHTKGGYELTPYLTYGCLIDTRTDFIDQPYLKTHFTCITCNIHMICTPGEQLEHINKCKPLVEMIEIEPESQEILDPNTKNKISYACQICNQTLMLSMTEILRHKNSHNNQ
ncbi:hypothetical protein HZS_5815 [Henneguya salminicola]|nr:hypothetical protein HZS_5815 [Henneguya salminicola]